MTETELERLAYLRQLPRSNMTVELTNELRQLEMKLSSGERKCR